MEKKMLILKGVAVVTIVAALCGLFLLSELMKEKSADRVIAIYEANDCSVYKAKQADGTFITGAAKGGVDGINVIATHGMYPIEAEECMRGLAKTAIELGNEVVRPDVGKTFLHKEMELTGNGEYSIRLYAKGVLYTGYSPEEQKNELRKLFKDLGLKYEYS